MKKKILISIMSLSHSALLLFMIALGSQNLRESNKINFGIFTTKEAYPTGFIIGISLVLGSISGGLTTICLVPSSKENLLRK